MASKSALYEPNVATKKATLAMACFWGPDVFYGCAPGVIRTSVGYSGGTMKDPTYTDLGDHTETIDIDYDPTVTSFEKMLDLFWKHHDPTAKTTTQYNSVIFYHDDDEKKLAEASKAAAQKATKGTILTRIEPVSTFYDAELYHHKYRLQNQKALFDSLGIQGDGVIRSHAAARLNGYVGGGGKLSDFEAEWEKLGLSKEQADMVRKLIRQASK